jgi:glycosyltransferase involved in cell wall biosynthesis
VSCEVQSKPISAVIPIRNGESFIEDCYSQVSRNLAKHDEAIFVVNGSSDLSYKLLVRLCADQNNMRVINLGEVTLVDALNQGIQESQHDWIARFDIDDLYDDFRISKQRDQINVETIAIFSDYRFIGLGKQQLGYIPSAIFNTPTLVSLFGKNRTAHPSVLFNKSAYESAGKYRREDVNVEDLSLWLRMARLGKFKTVPQPLLNYRLHGNSVIAKSRRLANVNSDKILNSIGLPSGILENAARSAKLIMSEYENFTYANERRLLFLANLYRGISMSSIDNKEAREVQRIFMLQISRPGIFSAGVRLGLDYRNRRNYRKQIQTEFGSQL